MQYNKGTKEEVLTRKRNTREDAGTLACVTSFGLSWWEKEEGRKKKKKKKNSMWVLNRYFPNVARLQDARRAIRAQHNRKSALWFLTILVIYFLNAKCQKWNRFSFCSVN